MLVEVCVDNMQSAINAVYNGADELSLCCNLPEGGLTPSFDFVKSIIHMINHYLLALPNGTFMRPKINILIRCSVSWDFCYTTQQIALMIHEVHLFKNLNVDGFIFGALTAPGSVSTNQIDDLACRLIIRAAYPKPVTFGRAFDITKNPLKAIREVISLGFSRLLTSGQMDCAANEGAIQLLKLLINKHGHQIEIMPGAGINSDNVKLFLSLGCTIIHGSFKLPLLNKCDDYITDGGHVRYVKQIISVCSQHQTNAMD